MKLILQHIYSLSLSLFKLINSDNFCWHDIQFKVNFIDPPPPEFSFAFAFAILRVINSEIILSRFALISVSMVVSKRVVLADVPRTPKTGTSVQETQRRYQKPERGYKKGTAAHKPERGHIRQNHPFRKPPFCLLSINPPKLQKNTKRTPRLHELFRKVRANL